MLSLCATYENWLRERLRNGRVRIKKNFYFSYAPRARIYALICAANCARIYVSSTPALLQDLFYIYENF